MASDQPMSLPRPNDAHSNGPKVAATAQRTPQEDHLEQGGTYVDLNRLGEGPFKALGGHEAGVGDRFVAKRDTDYELWNRLVGDDADPEIERP